MREMLESPQRTAVVKVRIMGGSAVKGGRIRYRDGRQAKQAVVLNDDDPRTQRLNRLPYPVLVAINIDGQQSDIAGKTGVLQQSIDVVFGDPRALGLQVKLPVDRIGLNI